ncbi:cobalamin-dependent protein, partial [bacterium]|nr:cobalamin-dependent protein [bacterium]
MKIVLVDPSPYRSFSVMKPYEHLGLGYLGAVLRDEGYDVQLFSSVLEQKNERRTVNALLLLDADVIGFSVKEIFARETINIVKGLRKAGSTAKIVFGGHYPTFNHEILLNTFPEIDFIVRGEGEYILLNLIRALERNGSFDEIAGLTFRQAEQVIVNDAVQYCLDVDTLLFPLRDYAPMTIGDSGEIAIAASRGCYANCSFCSIQTFYRGLKGKHYRRRSNDNILSEIEQLMQQFDCNSFNFVDDQFIPPGTIGQKAIESLSDEIIRRGLKIEFQCMTRVNDIREESLR